MQNSSTNRIRVHFAWGRGRVAVSIYIGAGTVPEYSVSAYQGAVANVPSQVIVGVNNDNSSN